MSPASSGGFFTTEPPGKHPHAFLKVTLFSIFRISAHLLGIKFLDLANKNTGQVVKFQFHKITIFQYEYIPNISWDTLVLKTLHCLPEIPI